MQYNFTMHNVFCHHPARCHPLAGARSRTWFHRLTAEISQNSLIETRPSLQALDGLARDAPPPAVFIGVGLCSPRRLTRALPLDLLGVLLPAEQIRRAVGASDLVVLVADAHARQCGYNSPRVSERAHATIALLDRVRRRCGLVRMRVVRASRLHDTAEHHAILTQVRRELPLGDHPYFAWQVADVTTLERLYGGLLKVGWAISGSPNVIHENDEVAFDQRFRSWSRRRLGFVYCRAGRQFDDRRLKTSPYVAEDPQRRVCLDSGQDVTATLNWARMRVSASTFRGVRNHLNAVARCYSEVVSPLRGTLSERLSAVVTALQQPPLRGMP